MHIPIPNKKNIKDNYKFVNSINSQYKYFYRLQIFYRLNIDTQEEEVLINNCSFKTNIQISPDDKFISYINEINEINEFTIYDIDKKTNINNCILKHYCSSYVWANNYLIYYSDNKLNKIWLYDLRNCQNTLIFTEFNKDYNIICSLSSDKKYVIITSSNDNSNYSLYIDHNNNTNKIISIKKLNNGVKYYVEHYQGTFYLLTNEEAQNYKIVKFNSEINDWEPLIPHNNYVKINKFKLFSEFLVFTTTISENKFINIYNFKNNTIIKTNNYVKELYNLSEYNNFMHHLQKIKYLYTIDFGINNIFETNILNIKFKTYLTPTTLYDYNMNTNEKILVYKKDIFDYDETLYDTNIIFIPSIENDNIIYLPLYIIYKKDKFIQDGTMQLYFCDLKYINFNPIILTILNEGKICAITPFDNFSKCTEYLIKNKYTNEGNILILKM
jgi:oligopeptidase B